MTDSYSNNFRLKNLDICYLCCTFAKRVGNKPVTKEKCFKGHHRPMLSLLAGGDNIISVRLYPEETASSSLQLGTFVLQHNAVLTPAKRSLKVTELTWHSEKFKFIWLFIRFFVTLSPETSNLKL